MNVKDIKCTIKCKMISDDLLSISVSTLKSKWKERIYKIVGNKKPVLVQR